jgi:Zn-dependent M28 family amino/carboxypeptidase
MRLFFVFILFLAIINNGNTQVDSNLIGSFKQHVNYLAADALEGRATGSKGEQLANAYLKDSFSKKRSRLYSWQYTIPTDTLAIHSELIGTYISNKSEKTVLIGAHVDHIGWGGELSKSPGKKQVHNGADDNASGVALLIELQRFFTNKRLPYNILLVAYTGHEIGTKGSEYVFHHLPKRVAPIAFVLNFDMVGRMDSFSKKCYVSTNYPSLFEHSTKDLTITVQDTSKVKILDTKHWYNVGIPAATFSTGAHNDYHKISDDAQYINYNGIAAIFEYLKWFCSAQLIEFLNEMENGEWNMEY